MVVIRSVFKTCGLKLAMMKGCGQDQAQMDSMSSDKDSDAGLSLHYSPKHIQDCIDGDTSYTGDEHGGPFM